MAHMAMVCNHGDIRWYTRGLHVATKIPWNPATARNPNIEAAPVAAIPPTNPKRYCAKPHFRLAARNP